MDALGGPASPITTLTDGHSHGQAWPQSDPSNSRKSHMADAPLGVSALSHPSNVTLRAQDVHAALNGHGAARDSLTDGLASVSTASLGQGGIAAAAPQPVPGSYSLPYQQPTFATHYVDSAQSIHQQPKPQPLQQPQPAVIPLQASLSSTGALSGSRSSKQTPSSAKAGPAVAGMGTQQVSNSVAAQPMAGAVPAAATRRVLTKPSEGVKNEGYDNENSDLVLRVGDVVVHSNPTHGVLRRYTIQHMLGQGTFGQVVSCWCDEMQRTVAVKVIKNQPAYFHQARVEIGLLHLLNTRCDPDDQRHIVRMVDSFIFRKHLCIVFEKLDVNLFELLKRNAFKGLSLPTVQRLLRQLLDSLAVLRDASIMHCDLKPENILLKSSGSDEIKLIDFGSACFENRVVYSYIQSRFYRSPEVVLGTSYNVAIDMWSLGCVAAELFLGLPLFPGASEHDLMVRIVETLGLPPDWLMREAKHTERYFKRVTVHAGGSQQLSLTAPSLLASSLTSGGLGPYDLASSVPRFQHQHLAQIARQQVGSVTGGSSQQHSAQWVLLSQAEFEARNACKAAVGKRYFMHTQLADIIAAYPMRPGIQDDEVDAEKRSREAFIDFLLGVLDLDPRTRWTPKQAAAHPFITGAPFTGPFQPPQDARPAKPIHGPTAGTAAAGASHGHNANNMASSVPTSGGMSGMSIPIAQPVAAASAMPIGGAAGGGGIGTAIPAPMAPQASLQGSFQTSFIMGTPHKRMAVHRRSPTATQQQQQQQVAAGGLGAGPMGPAMSMAGWPLQQGGAGAGGGSAQPSTPASATAGASGFESQQQQQQGADVSAVNPLVALMQSMRPQLPHMLQPMQFTGAISSSQPTQLQPPQPALLAPTPTDMQTDAPTTRLSHAYMAGAGAQGAGAQASSSQQGLAGIMLGSTPSTPHKQGSGWPAPWGAAGAGMSFSGNLGTANSATMAAAAAAAAVAAAQVGQGAFPQGLIGGVMHPSDLASAAALAAARNAQLQQQAQQQAQQQQQQSVSVGGSNVQLTPQQLLFLRQQQQLAGIALQGVAGGSWPQQQQQQQGGPAKAQDLPAPSAWFGQSSLPAQTAGFATQPAQPTITQQTAPMQTQGPHHGRQPSCAPMYDDCESPVTAYPGGAQGAGGSGGGGMEAASSQGTAPANQARSGASPAEWDPLAVDGDWPDAPASPQGGNSNGQPRGGRVSHTGGGVGRHYHGQTSSHTSSGADSAAVTSGARGGGGVVTSGMRAAPMSTGGAGPAEAPSPLANAIAALIAQQPHLQQPLHVAHQHQQPHLTGSATALAPGSQFGYNLGGFGMVSADPSQQQHGPTSMMVDSHAQRAMLSPQAMQTSVSSLPLSLPLPAGPAVADASHAVGSLPFSGIGAAPAMHMYQALLAQQQQQQQQQNRQ